MAKKSRKPMSQATKDKLSRAGKRRWNAMSASAKATAVRRLTGRASKGARKAGARAKSAATKTTRRVQRGLSRLTGKQILEGAVFVDGLWEGVSNGLDRNKAGTFGLNGDTMKEVLLPALDGAFAAKTIDVLATNSITAPTLVREILNMRPLALKFPKVTLGKVFDAAPAAAGWVEGYRRYRAHKPIYAASSYNPRLAAITGIQVQPHGDRFKLAFTRPTILDSAAAPVIAGGVISKGAHALRTSSLVPAGVKPLFSITPLKA